MTAPGRLSRHMQSALIRSSGSRGVSCSLPRQTHCTLSVVVYSRYLTPLVNTTEFSLFFTYFEIGFPDFAFQTLNFQFITHIRNIDSVERQRLDARM